MEEKYREPVAGGRAEKPAGRKGPEAPAGGLPGYRRELVGYVYRMIGDYHAAEDLVQETLLRAVKARSSLSSPEALRGWLYSIAYHVTVDWTRRRSAARRLARGYAIESGARGFGEDAGTPLVQAETREFLRRKVRWMWFLAEGLPAPYREVFELRYRRELSVSEIARKLGIREGNVKVRLHRARRMVRRLARYRAAGVEKSARKNSGAG